MAAYSWLCITASNGGNVTVYRGETHNNAIKINRTNPTRKKKACYILLVIVCAVIVAVALRVFVPVENSDVPAQIVVMPAVNIAVSERNDYFTKNDFLQIMTEQADLEFYILKITPSAVFDTETGNGTINIINLSENRYPINADIYLENGILIYETGTAYPGQAIEHASIVPAIDAGVYNAVAVVNIYDDVTRGLIGIVDVEIELTVCDQTAGEKPDIPLPIEVSLPTRISLGCRENDGGQLYSAPYRIINRSGREINVATDRMLVAPSSAEQAIFEGMVLELKFEDTAVKSILLRSNSGEFLGEELQKGKAIRLSAAGSGGTDILNYSITGKIEQTQIYALAAERPDSPQYILVFRISAA